QGECTMSPVELFQFDFSHFNEKVRWALDFKRIPHVRRSLLPGPHMMPIRRLTGQTSVPVVRVGERVIPGSSQIIAYLEELQPAPPLFPADPVACRRALEFQAWFDDEVGPAIRRAFFFEFLNDGGYAARTFSAGHGTVARLVYRGLFPGIRVVMRKSMQIDADGAARGRTCTKEALDLVAREAGPQGYLVGDRFSVADLTAASLLSPVAF